MGVLLHAVLPVHWVGLSHGVVQYQAWAGVPVRSAVQIRDEPPGPAMSHCPPIGLQYSGVPGATQFLGSTITSGTASFTIAESLLAPPSGEGAGAPLLDDPHAASHAAVENSRARVKARAIGLTRRNVAARAPVSTRKLLDSHEGESKVCPGRSGSKIGERLPDGGLTAMLWTRELRMPVALALIGLGASCSPNAKQEVTNDPLVCPAQSTDPLDSDSVEWVSYHTEVPFAPGDFHGLAAGLFGPDAQAGRFVTHQEVTPGVFVGAALDPTTPDQSRVTLSFDDGTASGRRIALVPASFATGGIFLLTIDAALATMQAEEKAQKGSSESFLLQYQVTSSMGGTFSFGVHGVTGVYTLVLDVSSPTTNLAAGKIGTPALSAGPYDTVNGTVWFHLSKDDFDYFVDHAYGSDATAAQNFKNFALEPHRWLRLTVTPHLTSKYVDVAFAVLGQDGALTPLAKAPASILAGGLFQSLVDRNMTTMMAQEKAKPGSSTPWTSPFYYDAPSGGGVVQVIAQGLAGAFTIAYAVEAPHHTIKDVPFLPYKPVAMAPPDPSATTACDKLGNPGIIAAPQGAFEVTFTVSSVITSAAHPPLLGDLECGVYRAADVTIEGPKNGAPTLQYFVVRDVDLQAPTPATFLTDVFPDGNYQILCFQDLKHDNNADIGDPVTLPIGNLPLACNVNPVTVQFALLNPGE